MSWKWTAVCLLLLWAVPASASRSVGVAPFERAGSGNVPEIATQLSDRLLTAGVECTGPDRVGVPAVARPDAAQVRAWAENSGVDALVFGRTTAIGESLSVDVQLRDAASGDVLDTYVVEISRPGAVGAGVDELARKVLAGLDTLSSAGTKAVAAGSAGSRGSGRNADPGTALFNTDSKSPISIKSDQLEARRSQGARHLIFTDHVRATQDDLLLTSDRLDAFYPKGSSRPEKLIATGNVVLDRDKGKAHCHKMTYVQAEQKIHCEGNANHIAQLTREGDRAKGDKIEWDLETDTVFIKGNADVLLEGGSEE